MLHLRRRKAVAPRGRLEEQQLLSSHPTVSSLGNTSLGFVSMVMSLNYRSKIPLQNLAQAERIFLVQGRSFQVEKTYIKDSTDERIPQAVVVKRPVDTGEALSTSHHWIDLCLEVQALLHPPIANHRNIVDLLAIGWETGLLEQVWPVLIMPYAACGSLDAFQLADEMSDELIFGLCLDVACGLEVLHGCGIIHGDIKSENVLVFWEDSGPVAKLCDFGCSIIHPQDFGKLVGGSQPWNCPEWRDTLPNENLPMTDVYCFGLLFWRTFSKLSNPFENLPSFSKTRPPNHGDIEELKRSKNDQFLEDIKDSLQLQSLELSAKENLVSEILNKSVRYEPRNRSLVECLIHLKELVTPGKVAPIMKHADSACGPIDINLFNFHDTIDFEAVPHFPWFLQVEIFEYHLKRQNGGTNIESHLWLFLCHLQGIGTDISKTLACECLLAAADSGNSIAKSLLHRTITALPEFSNSLIAPKTMAQWLLRSLEMGCVGANEDFAHLVQSLAQNDRALSETLLGWYPIALMRLRCFTSGVGAGYFLDALGNRLHPFSIESQAGFEKELSAKKKENEFDINKYTVNSRGDTLLHFTSTCGFHEATAFLIRHFQKSLDIHSMNEYGETALLSASRAGQLETTHILLRGGADLRPDNDGESPLHWLGAFTADIPEIASLMLQNSIRDGIGESKGKQLILNRKAPKRRYSPYWGSELPAGTPLHRAIHLKNLKAIATLLDLGSNPEEPGINETQASPLQLSCFRHQVQILELILDKMNIQDVTKLGGPPLLHIALSGHDNLRALINNGVRSRNSGDIKETVSLLMGRNANPGPILDDPHIPGVMTTALFKAVHSNSIICVELALSESLLTSKHLLNMPCGSPSLTPLNVAVENGSVPIIEALLAAGANPKNPRENNENFAALTALHSTAFMDFSVPPLQSLRIINLLTPYFADVDLQPDSGHIDNAGCLFESAFVLNARLHHFYVASALLDHGANIDFEFNRLVRDPNDENFTDESSNDELEIAIGNMNSIDSSGKSITLLGVLLSYPTPALLSVVRFLLGYDDAGKKKRDWEYTTPSPIVCKAAGWTVWHSVAARRFKLPIYAANIIRELVSYLLEVYKRLGPELLNRQTQGSKPGMTALHIAAECTNTEVVSALIKNGANVDAVDDGGARPLDYALACMQEDTDIDEERGWTEAEARREIQRRKEVYLMLGGSMDIFESDSVEELGINTH